MGHIWFVIIGCEFMTDGALGRISPSLTAVFLINHLFDIYSAFRKVSIYGFVKTLSSSAAIEI